jgi:DNA-binding transcriptional LysR family regulator
MKLNQIRDFIAVARAGSLRAAAKSLGLAQPSLTKSIAQLEEDLGAVLLERSSRGIRLTAAGLAFLDRAESAWHELSRGRAEVLELSQSERGSIAVGLSAAPSLIGLAHAMKSFQRAMPDVHVRVVTGNFPTVLPELRAGRLDFSIGPRPTYGVADEYVIESLMPNSRVVVCRREHPLRRARSLSELLGAEWILTSATGQPHEEFERYFTDHKFKPPKALMQCEYVTALLAMLAGSDMLALLPRQWAESDVTKNLLVKIPIAEILNDADICLIHRSGSNLTRPAKHFLTLLRRQFEYYAKAQRG